MHTTMVPLRSTAALLSAAALLAACASHQTGPSAPEARPSADVRQALAPTGALRIAAYPGSPTSMVRRPGSDEVNGMTIEVGRELARRLGVPATIVELERVEQVIEALRSGQADVTITNASAARAKLIDFSKPGYLVLPGSPVVAITDVDRAGIRIGVSQGGSSHATLVATYRNASVVPAPSLKVAAELLTERRIDAFASNKGILFQLADGLPGARVLDGRWGVETLAIGVPQGRTAGKAWLEGFAASVREEGLVQRSAQRAGLRGLAEPGP
jgi:polar amino acid transport system substrate-binding protein